LRLHRVETLKENWMRASDGYDSDFTLPPPGLVRVEVPNLGPVIDPKFTDARDWSEFLSRVETTPVHFEERDVTAIDAARKIAPEIALAAPRVRELLEGKRHEVISVGTRAMEDDCEHPVVVIYNYSDDNVIEVLVDATAQSIVGINVSADSGPPMSAAEEERAKELVRRDGFLADNGIDVGTGAGLVVEEVDFRSPRYRHRLIDLRFGPLDRRLPTAFAIVDLSAADVVKTGLICEK
jgi:hypothetical protein